VNEVVRESVKNISVQRCRIRKSCSKKNKIRGLLVSSSDSFSLKNKNKNIFIFFQKRRFLDRIGLSNDPGAMIFAPEIDSCKRTSCLSSE
jgi:hypothetical protein